jgi:ABC-type phosphate/phosphonate transport system ATPase subunit
MIRLFKALVTRLRHYSAARNGHLLRYRALDLGFRVYDEQATRVRISIPNNRRAEHIAILGKTGTGKSSLLRFFLKQDIQAGRGFACFDLHGDLTSFVLSTLAAQEKILKRHFSNRTG